ncbi:MAG: AMP-binding protein [Gammaproteobacteria bacterium]|nr:AMP-binding protein [Gammaproteobacteria bacterium]
MNSYTAHIDTFASDNLPPKAWRAKEIFNLDSLQFPEKLNCAEILLDEKITAGHGDKIALRSDLSNWTYQVLYEKANQIAHVLIEDFDLVPGNRVLLRAANNLMLAASWLAVVKAGGIAVTTMPLLRARDLQPVINKAEVKLALCDTRLQDELNEAQQLCPGLEKICFFDGSKSDDANTELESLMSGKPTEFDTVQTAAEDIVLIAFTSGTTGQPKGTMHNHRDVMAVCICVCDDLIKPVENDVFIGSPPMAFTFGLGMQLLFPLYTGASSALLEAAPPAKLIAGIEQFGASICSTSPTAYRAMLADIDNYNISSLIKPVSAGEHLPQGVFEQWQTATGNNIIDGLGATELLHIFVGANRSEVPDGATGKALAGYECCVLNEDNSPVPPGQQGRLAVIGPSSCKYLADERQRKYVIDGWNVPGDICHMDEDGYVYYKGRADDMIISSGYNISGPEVEAALLTHKAVLECAVVGAKDVERGTIVKAFVVLESSQTADSQTVSLLQKHVKESIAPYKYPRAIEFVDALPKTQTGKIQRHKLRD